MVEKEQANKLEKMIIVKMIVFLRKTPFSPFSLHPGKR